MKTLTLIFSIISLLTFNSLGQTTDINKLLEKPETRTEIFNDIVNNHQLMMEFSKVAKGNEHAMMMLNENNQMKDETEGVEMKGDVQMDHNKMMGMMKDDPEMMQKMMGQMMNMCEQDSTMRNIMAEMMSDHPKMMQMCQQKMKEKGMKDKEGKMDMMNSKSTN